MPWPAPEAAAHGPDFADDTCHCSVNPAEAGSPSGSPDTPSSFSVERPATAVPANTTPASPSSTSVTVTDTGWRTVTAVPDAPTEVAVTTIATRPPGSASRSTPVPV